MASTETFDFIIVGGDYLSAPAHRVATCFNRQDLDHGYASEPEPALNGREIPYAPGNGLGGSSLINFGVYLYGSRDDYDRWAGLVGDDSWAWESVRESFHAIESYQTEGVESYVQVADPAIGEHGANGCLKVGLPAVLERGVVEQIGALLSAGEKLCLDPNSGDPIGVSVFPSNYAKEGRCTSATAHLRDPPENLKVWTEARVTRLMFEGTKVVGIETADGTKARSNQEVIICSGSIDTPRLLLLNGIGSRSELESLGIEVKKDLPAVGKHLKDHILALMCVEVDGALNDRTTFETSPELQQEGQEMWDRGQTGALSLQQSGLWGGFLKMHELEATPEFTDLPPDQRKFLNRKAVPHFEFINNSLLWPPGSIITEGNTYMTFLSILMNPQSEGSVTLRSNDPYDSPVIRFNFYSHPYDVPVFRAVIRITWKMIVENPGIAPHVRRTIFGPESMSDADIHAFCRDQIMPVWHANGTVRMGRKEDGGCVDVGGKVYGVQGLRVADLAVCPLTPDNHTQATAYLVGQKISEKMIQEYGLDGRST